MGDIILGIATAFWFGVLTSISPCPLATNIAAISYTSRKVTNSKNVLFSSLSYTLGRVLVYILLTVLLVAGIMSSPWISKILQKYLNTVLGPLLIFIGMILLEMITLKINLQFSDRLKTEKLANLGIIGAFLLGIIFALSFCPVSAAIYFGSFIPMVMQTKASSLMAVSFGVGTALPVIIFAVVISFSAQGISKLFNKVKDFEIWARRITGIIFIVAGIYLSLIYIFKIQI
ncbi:MAG: sulfite exporter TauE/SafE family protein [Acidobacteria bacterium]|nr:sulfite exporter TauE/SafE family protein [Acidobacteriota bacterium]